MTHAVVGQVLLELGAGGTTRTEETELKAVGGADGWIPSPKRMCLRPPLDSHRDLIWNKGL